ncbi:MAG TPA: M20/M25/M40 family metallo-hydrolase [Thermoanaerobaculia bacterium]|nr:M20/M25/M40 family metallo-hydrolase [Thermoanaerobaculia bacterium]
MSRATRRSLLAGRGRRRVGAIVCSLLSGVLAAPAQAGPPASPREATPVDPIEVARAFRQAHEAEILAAYVELLAIPNVADDSVNIRRNAEVIRELLVQRGVDAELWDLPGRSEVPPVVHGRLAGGGAEPGAARRSLGIYVHYDGQPVDPERWTATRPWEPALYSASLEDGGRRIELPRPGAPVDPEWRLYARSAGDDKAPLAALFAALDALHEAGIEPTSDLVFLFEGEEEAGSPHLEEFLRAHREALEVDAWLIWDGPVHASRRPQLVFGVRGYSGLEVTVYGAVRNLHSGHYGNWAPNPSLLLAHLLASMRHPDGEVRIAGFGDSTVPPTTSELAAIAGLPDFDDALRAELGLAETEGGGALLAERILHPSLNVRGLDGGPVGEGARNVIPSSATASIDVRLAKGNEPEEMLDLVEAHIRAQGFHLVREEPDLEARLRHRRIARVVRRGGYPAARTSMDHPLARQVIAAARQVAGDELVLLPTLGGSLPLHLFVEVLAAPVVIVPIANHDNNQHAPDENLRLANLWYGIELMAALLTMEP